MLQSHAAVYCGDQKRSYHGTTIQLVQPFPHHTFTSIVSPVNNTMSAHELNVSSPINIHDDPGTITSQCKRTALQAGASSPHKLGKVGPKRPRTVSIKKCMIH